MDWSEKLGKLLMRDVRDRSVDVMLQMLDEQTKAPRVAAMRRALQEKHGDAGVEGARFVLNETVDVVMFHFLSLFEAEAEVLKLGVEDDGTWVDAAQTSDGLAGELYSSEGWIRRYSQYAAPISQSDLDEPTPGVLGAIRERIVEVLGLIADGEVQTSYQSRAPVNVSEELFNRWGDWYRASNPSLSRIFDQRELEALARFDAIMDAISDELPQRLPPLEEFMQTEAWRRLRSAAARALVELARKPAVPVVLSRLLPTYDCLP